MLGEGYNFSAAEHLHFIDYVFADLCFQIGNVVYILEAHGRHVTLKYYKASIKHYFIYNHIGILFIGSEQYREVIDSAQET